MGSEQRLSTSQKEQIKQINGRLSDTLLAARQAFHTPAENEAGPLITDRVEQLRKLIRDGKCQENRAGQESRADHPWQAQWEVSSSDCPALIFEYSEYKPDQGKWFLERTIQIRTTDFQGISGLNSLRARGSLILLKNGMVKGKVKYDPFQVAGIGEVHVELEVDAPDKNRGAVQVRINAPDMYAKGVLRWDGRRLTYFLNDAETELRDFNELFSAFQPFELMDRARDMR